MNRYTLKRAVLLDTLLAACLACGLGMPAFAADDQAVPANVAMTHDVSDSQITTDVKTLLAERIPAHYKVDVTTTGGVVFLKGNLADQAMIERVRGMVLKVDGVKSVNTVGIDAPGITVKY